MQMEMLALGEAGYREVTLLGQNVDAYGRDLPGAADDGTSSEPYDLKTLNPWPRPSSAVSLSRLCERTMWPPLVGPACAPAKTAHLRAAWRLTTVRRVSRQEALLGVAGSGRRAWTFADLLHAVHDVPGIQRIRFATSHPR